MAPGKPAPSGNLVMILQVAQNPLTFAMLLNLLVLKMSLCFFFQEGIKIWTKLLEIRPPPPPLSLSVSNQRRISILESQNTLLVCCTLLEGGRDREGGWAFKNVFKASFPRLWKKKTQGHFCTEKELAWQISVDSEQLGKSLRICHLGPASSDPFNYIGNV